ncbi:MAG TPA: alpha/beta hydrolase [Allosphingosinicella sp.]|nr:alpha/beta hydrolase [Allosphingosinicella sp.]
MSRIIMGTTLLFCVLLVLAVPATYAQPAGPPIDQAGWAARKRTVALPNGVRLAYVELGNPAGRPLLLLHGYTDSSRVWTILAPWLAGHRILIPDQRGHGASSAPRCCYGPSDFTEDARLFLDAMHVERAAIVGHSMGSMVAQTLAAEYPERVTRIVLIGSTALVPVRRGDWIWTQVMGLREPIAGNPANAEFLRLWGPRSSPTPVDPVLTRYYEPEIAATPPHVWRGVLRSLVEVPVGRLAADVRAPVQILSGGRDELFPAEHHAALVAAYPGSEAHVFPALGHNLILERPEELGPVLARFLAQEPAAGGSAGGCGLSCAAAGQRPNGALAPLPPGMP